MNRRPDRWWENVEWWEYTYADQAEAREDLYASGATAFWHLPTLASLWLEELKRVGLKPVDASSGAPTKQREADPEAHTVPGRTYSLRLQSGKFLWLRTDGRRTGLGYKGVEISDQPLTTDLAVVAALTALEASQVGKREIDKLVSLLKAAGDAPLDGSIGEHLDEALDKLREEGRMRSSDVRFRKSLDLRPFEYCLALLRDRYTGFDGLPRGEQLGLLRKAFSYINPIVDNVQKLAKFLEYGSPRGLPTRTLETAGRRVRAALLRDVASMSPAEIAEELNIAKPPDFEDTGDVPEVRDLAKSGRGMLKEALGEEGLRTLVEANKAEMQRWKSLSDEQKAAEFYADLYDYEGWPSFVAEGIRKRTDESSPAPEDDSE